MAKTIMIRDVWHDNILAEFDLINQSLDRYPYASMDTEFPGTVYQPSGVPDHLRSTLPPQQFYAVMKQNVDALKIIQLGLTLSDEHGNLPHFNSDFQYVWQFNFRDFDPECDIHNPESIALLKRQGIDFLMNKKHGIDSSRFAKLFNKSGLGLKFKVSTTLRVTLDKPKMKWVTFHGPYDFGFLIKVLTQKQLPNDMDFFLQLVKSYCGETVYDLKNLMKDLGLHGGLDQVAKSLNLDRDAGKSHQAGSDSLLTMRTFFELRKKYFNSESDITKFNVYGLTCIC